MHSDGYYIFKLQKLKKFPKELEDAVKLYNDKDYKRASLAFQNFINRGLENEDIYRLGYISYILSKDYDKASTLIKEFESKYELKADDHYNYALISSYLNILKEKESHFDKALSLDPNHSPTLNAIGYNLNTKSEFDKAIIYFDKAIEMEPDFAYAYNNRGHAKMEIGKLEEGLEDIHHSLNLDNTNSYVYRNLGIYHLKLKEYGKAKDFFLKAQQMDKETELIEELLEKAKQGNI